MSKKILIVTEYFYPEDFKINEIALAWKEKGYEVDVLTQSPTYPFGKIYDGYKNIWYSKDTYKGITIYRVKAVTGYKTSKIKKLLKYFTFMFFGSIVSLKIGKKYDYIFGFDIAALTGMVPATLLKKFYDKPVTLWVQDVWPDSVYAYGFKKTKFLESSLNAFVRFVYRHTSHFAISGQGFEKRILPYIANNQDIEYLPNWADEFNKDLEAFTFSDEERVQFTFAGNVGKVQNLDNIIKAFGLLSDTDLQKAQLNIIGDGSHLENLKELVHNNNIPNVIFWGRQPRDEMYKYFKGSDFLIVSLIDEPIFELTVPAKTQTYIAAGKPILAVISGDAADIIRDNNLGYTAQPDNIDDIKNAFIQCINTSKEEINNFTQNCEHLTQTTFNREKIIDSLLQLMTGQNK